MHLDLLISILSACEIVWTYSFSFYTRLYRHCYSFLLPCAITSVTSFLLPDGLNSLKQEENTTSFAYSCTGSSYLHEKR